MKTVFNNFPLFDLLLILSSHSYFLKNESQGNALHACKSQGNALVVLSLTFITTRSCMLVLKYTANYVFIRWPVTPEA